MSQLDKEQTSLIEKLINQHVIELFSKSKEDMAENNSYLFLEKDSLNLLLAYLMFMKKNADTPTLETESVDSSELLDHLDTLIDENKQEFESLLNLFKSIK